MKLQPNLKQENMKEASTDYFSEIYEEKLSQFSRQRDCWTTCVTSPTHGCLAGKESISNTKREQLKCKMMEILTLNS